MKQKTILKNNMDNYFRNICKAKADDRLWTTYKDSYDDLKGRRYGKQFLDKNNNELFVKQGLKIDCTYESEYSAGDKIYISANNCYFFKIQLDSALKETVVYAPSGSFEYRIPIEVLERIYEEGAFAVLQDAAVEDTPDGKCQDIDENGEPDIAEKQNDDDV